MKWKGLVSIAFERNKRLRLVWIREVKIIKVGKHNGYEEKNNEKSGELRLIRRIK